LLFLLHGPICVATFITGASRRTSEVQEDVFTRHRSAWRRSNRRNRKTQVTVSVAVAVVAVAAAVAGISLADQHVESLNQAALGDCLSSGAAPASGAPAVNASGAPQSPAASPAPCASAAAASPSAGPRVKVAPNDFATGPIATQQLGDVATNPVDGAGDAINLNQTADEAADSGNCTIVVPRNPLTAQGLATPYQLADGCSMANGDQQAYVEATILSPNGQVQVYNPLVITQGTKPAMRPVVPRIPRGSRVIIDFGFNGTNLLLTGPGAVQRASGCVDALGQSVIGQVSACGAVPFYNLANQLIARHVLRVPRAGTALDGQPCQTTRDFALIDQDQSDNVYSMYLLTADGRTAQATKANKANKARMGNAQLISNGSDNALLGYFVDPANGCKPFTGSDATSTTGTQGSQALDELSARVNQKPHIAMIPTNDEMVLVGGAYSIAKTNMYRSLVDMPMLAANTNPNEVAAAYCMNMVNIAPAHDQADAARDANFDTPVPDVGNNLATFIGNRLSMSFANLNCGDFGLTDPTNVTAGDDGVATAVTYNTAQQQATIPASDANPQGGNGHNGGHSGGQNGGPSQGHGRHHKFHSSGV
jgi:hypothetical protein